MRWFVIVLVLSSLSIQGQDLIWSSDGKSLHQVEGGEIASYALPGRERSILISRAELTPPSQREPLDVRQFSMSPDQSLVLIFTATRKVWRLDTKGNYWLLDRKAHKLQQLGRDRPASSLMFAKLSPDGTKVAYVSEQNLFVEDLHSGISQALTTDGDRKTINGTFDWAYEEEFACRDGFQWSPDSKRISFWHIDANRIRDFYMINNTDSVYSRIVPVEYPTIGQSPSPAKIGVYDLNARTTTWLAIPGDPQQHYLPRMEWNSPNSIFVQQLNRKQNQSTIYNCNPATGESVAVWSESDPAWIDVHNGWENVYDLTFRHRFRWLNHGSEFLWVSDKGGWRQLYRISLDGKKETRITNGAFDVIDIRLVDESANEVYFLASPTNATQRYLYKTKLDGKGVAERVSPNDQSGTHDYLISPSGAYAFHTFSNVQTQPLFEFITLRPYGPIDPTQSISSKLPEAHVDSGVEFFKVKTAEGVEMDGWMVKPKSFDPARKYPVLFFVYSEPANANVLDAFGAAQNTLFNGNLADEGYIYISIDNRGTPVPKGRDWRKSIYRKIGIINIRDQALATQEVLKWPFVDADRVAVWGWSGGGAATLNLMFQFPDLYKTGIAVSAISNQLTYDNIYQERYMGIPQESMADIVAGSPITYAKNLKGKLLYIHGTGDDNVHYANAEMLINELVRHNKQFQFMPYPNRTHSISEGEGTTTHLSTLYSNFLRSNCNPGPK